MLDRIASNKPELEEDLISRARRGDTHAFGDLVTLHGPLAFRTAFHITSSAADAEDAAQEGFVKAFQSLSRFDPSRPFRPWLLRIVANEARNRTRSQGRRAVAELRAASLPEEHARSVEAEVIEAEERDNLLRALNQSQAEDRTVLACRYLLELSVEETAGALGLASGTVKSRCSRALARLRTLMEDQRA